MVINMENIAMLDVSKTQCVWLRKMFIKFFSSSGMFKIICGFCIGDVFDVITNANCDLNLGEITDIFYEAYAYNKMARTDCELFMVNMITIMDKAAAMEYYEVAGNIKKVSDLFRSAIQEWMAESSSR